MRKAIRKESRDQLEKILDNYETLIQKLKKSLRSTKVVIRKETGRIPKQTKKLLEKQRKYE